MEDVHPIIALVFCLACAFAAGSTSEKLNTTLGKACMGAVSLIFAFGIGWYGRETFLYILAPH